MPIHKEVEFRCYVTEDPNTGEFLGEFSLTEKKGGKIYEHYGIYVKIDGEHIRYRTEQEATDATNQAAIQYIDNLPLISAGG